MLKVGENVEPKVLYVIVGEAKGCHHYGKQGGESSNIGNRISVMIFYVALKIHVCN